MTGLIYRFELAQVVARWYCSEEDFYLTAKKISRFESHWLHFVYSVFFYFSGGGGGGGV